MRDLKLSKEKNERLLVLVIDVDNDLYRKTKIGGPLLGRVQNLNGATQLGLADPEDPDSNTMFAAVKIYDQLKEDGYQVNIATITGAESGGYAADSEIVRQLEHVLQQYKSDSCIFVGSGASDERVMPLIESRIKISSVKPVIIKQAQAFENTYVKILDKLQEPHYARIVFGIPAIVLLLFAISYAIGIGWQVPVGIIGVYLVLKGFGIEDSLISSFNSLGFSLDKMSFVFYLSALVFSIASLFLAVGNYAYQIKQNSLVISVAYALEGFMVLIPVAMILYLAGRSIDTRSNRYIFRNFKYGVYVGSVIIFWVLVYTFIAWIIGQLYFSQFLLFTIIAIIVGISVSSFSNVLRRRALRQRRLVNKTVINEVGALIGKVTKVDARNGKLIVNTSFGNPIKYGVDRIVEISDKVVIK